MSTYSWVCSLRLGGLSTVQSVGFWPSMEVPAGGPSVTCLQSRLVSSALFPVTCPWTGVDVWQSKVGLSQALPLHPALSAPGYDAGLCGAFLGLGWSVVASPGLGTIDATVGHCDFLRPAVLSLSAPSVSLRWGPRRRLWTLFPLGVSPASPLETWLQATLAVAWPYLLAHLLWHVHVSLRYTSWSCSFDLYLCRWAACLVEPSSSTYICVVELGSVVAGVDGSSLLSQPRFQSMRLCAQ